VFLTAWLIGLMQWSIPVGFVLLIVTDGYWRRRRR
jgi:hypothetical protein